MSTAIRHPGLLTYVLITVLAIAAAMAPFSPPTVMGIIAVGLFLVLKVLTFLSQTHSEGRWYDLLVWCFATPTLNAADFLAGRRASAAVRWKSEILLPLAFVIFGLATLIYVVPVLKSQSPDLAGYAAIIALLSVLHFGLLHLIVSFWNLAGFKLRPLMNAPWASSSVTEFWGQRWNTAFRDLVHRHVFLPTLRRYGQTWALLTVFLASGLIHELAISVPTRAGYGGPTLYFLIQAVAVLMERRFPEGRSAATRTVRRITTWIVLLLPVPLLFHPPFRDRVILALLPW